MNMRQHKQRVMALMHKKIMWNVFFIRYNGFFTETPEEVTASKERLRQQWEELLSPLLDPVPAPADVKIFKVVRAKDNVVVLETESLVEAEEAVMKAARQKKAKLMILSDESYVFEKYDAKNFVHMV